MVLGNLGILPACVKLLNYLTQATSLLAHLILYLCSVCNHWFDHLPPRFLVWSLAVPVLAFHVKMPKILFEKKSTETNCAWLELYLTLKKIALLKGQTAFCPCIICLSLTLKDTFIT